MAIRLRTIKGVRVALCAVETDERPGDIYLDDGDHYVLVVKFVRDFMSKGVLPEYPDELAAMDSQKIRDAKDELLTWLVRDEITDE